MKINVDDNILFQNYVKNELSGVNGKDPRIELVIRPDCNQSCQYCYLTQHGKEIYPIEKRASKETILNNIKMLLEYFIKNSYKIYNWDIFAGDLFYDDIWFDIMDLILNYHNRMNIDKKSFIIIPCNFSFCEDDNKIKKVQEYIDKFLDNDIIVSLSYSSDGKYSTDIREKKQLTDEYYNKVFSLIEKNHWGCHPMISYEGIDNAIKNYDWWIEQYNKYNFEEPWPCMLEVRNDGWTNESITKYLELLDHIIKYRLKICDNDIYKFTRHIFDYNENLKKDNIPTHISSMDPILLYHLPKESNIMNCGLGFCFTINCMDLSIITCHRLAYSFFTGGKFKVENNEIIDVEPTEGMHGFFAQKMANTSYGLDCTKCINKNFCIKGCRGAQFEYSTETFLPIPSVCNLFNKKINFLIETYHNLGVFKQLFKLNILSNDIKFNLIKLLKNKGYHEYEYEFL